MERFADLKTSERTITRGRQDLGWVHQTAKYAQLARAVNKRVKCEDNVQDARVKDC